MPLKKYEEKNDIIEPTRWTLRKPERSKLVSFTTHRHFIHFLKCPRCLDLAYIGSCDQKDKVNDNVLSSFHVTKECDNLQCTMHTRLCNVHWLLQCTFILGCVCLCLFQIKGTVRLFMHVIVSFVITAFDYLFFTMLDIIRRHTEIDFKYSGT